jgi:hypothetical protein
MVTPDWPSEEEDVRDVQAVHWVVCNSPGDQVRPKGDVALAYVFPMLPFFFLSCFFLHACTQCDASECE